jgi:hypothetical protein
VGCDNARSIRSLPTFRKNLLFPSSGSKSKLRKRLHEVNIVLPAFCCCLLGIDSFCTVDKLVLAAGEVLIYNKLAANVLTPVLLCALVRIDSCTLRCTWPVKTVDRPQLVSNVSTAGGH